MTLEMTTNKLLAMLREGEEEEERERGEDERVLEGGGSEGEAKEAEEGGAGVEDGEGTLEAPPATVANDTMKPVEDVAEEVSEAAGKWAALPSVVTWNVKMRIPRAAARRAVLADNDGDRGNAEQEMETAAADKEGDEGTEQVAKLDPQICENV
jgi:hypothetical protein